MTLGRDGLAVSQRWYTVDQRRPRELVADQRRISDCYCDRYFNRCSHYYFHRTCSDVDVRGMRRCCCLERRDRVCGRTERVIQRTQVDRQMVDSGAYSVIG